MTVMEKVEICAYAELGLSAKTNCVTDLCFPRAASKLVSSRLNPVCTCKGGRRPTITRRQKRGVLRAASSGR